MQVVVSLFIGMFLGILFGAFALVAPSDVISGDEFIYRKATYRCEKTNELIGRHR